MLIDLNNIPKQWIHGSTPPEVDQKLYETQILYDRDWSLTNTKLLMTKSYSSPGRVDIRTKAYIVESDIYQSRATSAFSRKDFKSAKLFAIMALENILRVMIEIALEPFSNSRFVEKLEESTARLGMHSLFSEYLEITELDNVNDASIKDKLRLFKIIWDEIRFTVNRNPQDLESSHFKIKTKLKYYLNPAFLQGMIMRTKSLINLGEKTEAMRYMNNILIDIIENYAWLKASINNVKMGYTTLMRSLESLEKKNPKNYKHITNFLDLSDINKPNAA